MISFRFLMVAALCGAAIAGTLYVAYTPAIAERVFGVCGRNGQQLASIRQEPTEGPLRVSAANPGYLEDAKGRVVYLAGSHTWSNFQDNGISDPPPRFDFSRYLRFLVQHNHNYTRIWVWEQPKWTNEIAEDYWIEPMPFARTGPGLAADGKPKFDITKFNETFFLRLKERVDKAARRGVYVSVMLFNGFSVEHPKGRWDLNSPWRSHPFNANNNINGLDGDPNGDGNGEEVHSLLLPEINAVQLKYVQKVLDTLDKADNVLIEISNESGALSKDWQAWLVKEIKLSQKHASVRHPIHLSASWGLDGTELWEGNAAVVSPGWPSPKANFVPFRDAPPVNGGRKVVINDTDHLWGKGGNVAWVWKNFVRGNYVAFMDPYDGKAIGLGAAGSEPAKMQKYWEPIRDNLGYTVIFSQFLDLGKLRPAPERCSTGYCLISKSESGEAVVFSDSQDPFSVDFPEEGTALNTIWFSPRTGCIYTGQTVEGVGRQMFDPIVASESVLLLTNRTLGELVGSEGR